MRSEGSSSSSRDDSHSLKVTAAIGAPSRSLDLSLGLSAMIVATHPCLFLDHMASVAQALIQFVPLKGAEQQGDSNCSASSSSAMHNDEAPVVRVGLELNLMTWTGEVMV